LTGLILPGQTTNITFQFKSPNGGIFTEEWYLETHPTLCAGRAILVTLHGIATQHNDLENERRNLEVSFNTDLQYFSPNKGKETFSILNFS